MTCEPIRRATTQVAAALALLVAAASADAAPITVDFGNPVQWSLRTTAVPEPGTLALFGLGLLGLASV